MLTYLQVLNYDAYDFIGLLNKDFLVKAEFNRYGVGGANTALI